MKLEIGKQYKTRGGWRAVVVAANNDGTFKVWHEEDSKIGVNHKTGNVFSAIDNLPYDLIAEYKDPETKTIYVHWCLLENDKNYIFASELKTKFGHAKSYKAVAKVTLVEGQFDE